MVEVTTNCDACGVEVVAEDLKTIKLAGLSRPLSVCSSCLNKSAEESFKDAAEILAEILTIAHRADSAEARLTKIRNFLGG